MSTKLLNTGAWLITAIIAAGLLFSMVFSAGYKTSNARVVESNHLETTLVSYAELSAILENTPPNICIVDLRDAAAFASGHIPGAISVPFESLLEKKNLRTLRSHEQIILYAAHEQDATMAAMVLSGKGMVNTRFIPGGYDEILRLVIREGLDPAYKYYSTEKARFDYPRFMQAGEGAQTGTPSVKPVLPNIKAETPTVKGGC